MMNLRPGRAPAPERAYAIFPHVLNANITALNYEVGRTGPDDLKPLTENNWSKPFVAGVIDVKSTVTESAEEVADHLLHPCLGLVAPGIGHVTAPRSNPCKSSPAPAPG